MQARSIRGQRRHVLLGLWAVRGRTRVQNPHCVASTSKSRTGLRTWAGEITASCCPDFTLSPDATPRQSQPREASSASQADGGPSSGRTSGRQRQPPGGAPEAPGRTLGLPRLPLPRWGLRPKGPTESPGLSVGQERFVPPGTTGAGDRSGWRDLGRAGDTPGPRLLGATF